jgi:hypothetical protein
MTKSIISVKSHVTGRNKGTKWTKLTDQLFDNLTETGLDNTDIRDQIQRDQKGMFVNLEGFLQALYDAESKNVSLATGFSDEYFGDSATTSSGKHLQEGIRVKYAEAQKIVRELTNGVTMSDKYEVDHVNVTPVNTRITALIEVLEMIKEDYRQVQEKGRGSNLGQKMYSDMSINPTNALKAISELDTRINHLKLARAFMKELERNMESGATPSEQDLTSMLRANAKDNYYDITADKINDVNVYESGGDLGSFQIITESAHTSKSQNQRIMGSVLNRVMLGSYKLPENIDPKEEAAIRKMYTQLTDAHEGGITVVGSEGIENSINRQMIEILKGKTPKPSKSRTRTTKKIKVKVDLRKTKAAVAKLKAKKLRIKKALLLAGKTEAVKKRIRRSSSGQAKSALHLKRLINRRLPAEVRRNMGRPALRNKSGRFSNSVKLESLVPSKAGMVGKYSYMYSPYETFENTGAKRWPGAYNPKPLITKSIRNLAVPHMETKLTLRRT